MPRFCTECRTSRMPDDVRHLHELQVGDRFQMRGLTDQFVLEHITPARAMIVPVQTSALAETVSFPTRFGEPVAFTKTARRAIACSPFTMVEVVR